MYNDIIVPISTPPIKTSLYQRLVREWSDALVVVPLDKADPLDGPIWIEDNFLIRRPRDPITADVLPKGPIRLAEYQRRIVREALSRDADGKLNYSTVLWSEPKKSGKTALAAAVGMFMAWLNDGARIYCLANDGKQSKDRIFNAMADCLTLHTQMGGIFAGLKATYSPPTIKINNSVIEAIPCDAAGEAGAEPTMTIWSEMWGYAQKHKERIWTEMTIPPTLWGYAMRWVESYAGYEDESVVLWQLYDTGVNNGRRHPQFPDLPVYINDTAKQLTFWSEEARQPWQTKDYYDQEATVLTPNEFKRIHRNQWVTSSTALFEDIFTWDACKDSRVAIPLEPGDMTPLVVALDAGYASDCFAIVAVSRHPEDTWDRSDRRCVERYAAAFTPPKGGQLDFSKIAEPPILKLAEDFNVYRFVYDPYQLHKMCTDLRNAGVGSFEEFSQAGARLRADKQLYDMIIARQYLHSGDPTVRQHVQNAAKTEKGSRHLRFMKKVAGKPIDLVVATSMAVDKCLSLNTLA